MDFKNTIKLILFMLGGILILAATIFLLPFILLAMIIFMLLPNRKSKSIFESARKRYSRFQGRQPGSRPANKTEQTSQAPPASEDVIDVVAKEVDNSD
ncbi:hypothetical protein P0136_03215 [Lentisphaerota bacterium ZTH]|nr:hypothetical protein JYG24_05650 [Lentisphaerota bacterium]WET07012.1 hypothetical protein P0136_03215 [Lentisphaerota bacterium ZTH]